MNRPTTSPQTHPPHEPRTILLIDTCGATGSIALAQLALAQSAPAQSPAPARILATESLPGRSASERLLPTIRSLAAGQGIELHALAAIAVVYGPGSFTGERVGLAAAKGLCEALAVPLIAISRLAVLAAKSVGDPVVALLDAGRGELYAGEYSGGACLGEALLTRDAVLALIARLGKPSLVACEPSVAEAFAATGIVLVPELTATDVLPLAAARTQAVAFDDIASIDANYVRRTDAEIFAKPKPAAART